MSGRMRGRRRTHLLAIRRAALLGSIPPFGVV